LHDSLHRVMIVGLPDHGNVGKSEPLPAVDVSGYETRETRVQHPWSIVRARGKMINISGRVGLFQHPVNFRIASFPQSWKAMGI